MYGLTTRDLRQLAYQMEERNNISHRFSHDENAAGKDWLYGFKKKTSRTFFKGLGNQKETKKCWLERDSSKFRGLHLLKEELTDGGLSGSIFAFNVSGWMHIEVSKIWFDHFESFVKSNLEIFADVDFLAVEVTDKAEDCPDMVADVSPTQPSADQTGKKCNSFSDAAQHSTGGETEILMLELSFVITPQEY
ncbi:hypothetical protein HHI36_018967 [Cryptolaemus montrouzieri]|uniref:HTH CENPB-type domain-containing protein n=1 Tax=Cryptolaemus montrouzieri TaxID=559131 RepID=A0ABD2P274_9CUCU